jgi:hypothetical protein
MLIGDYHIEQSMPFCTTSRKSPQVLHLSNLVSSRFPKWVRQPVGAGYPAAETLSHGYSHADFGT